MFGCNIIFNLFKALMTVHISARHMDAESRNSTDITVYDGENCRTSHIIPICRAREG